jgi:hypothetical protein
MIERNVIALGMLLLPALAAGQSQPPAAVPGTERWS